MGSSKRRAGKKDVYTNTVLNAVDNRHCESR